jgi:hypothetical protein
VVERASPLIRRITAVEPTEKPFGSSLTKGTAHLSSVPILARKLTPMWLLIVAALCAGVFAGAAIYINLVEHPARLSCGTEVAVREFAPSYHRATLMQVPLALTGGATGLWSAWVRGDAWVAMGAILLVAVVPFTLIAILPTNKQLTDPALDPRGRSAMDLLVRWGRLHTVRSAASVAAFLLFLLRLATS